jgi:hypothetical protein
MAFLDWSGKNEAALRLSAIIQQSLRFDFKIRLENIYVYVFKRSFLVVCAKDSRSAIHLALLWLLPLVRLFQLSLERRLHHYSQDLIIYSSD